MSAIRNKVFAQTVGVGQDILSTSLDPKTGTILAQLGDATAGVPDIDEATWAQPIGFWSRPARPTPNTPVNGGIAAQAFTTKNGDRDIVTCSRDVRTNQRYGNLSDGDTCIGASTGMASVFCKAVDGSVTIATSDTNDRTGNSMFLKLAPTEFRFWAPFGSQLQDKTGLHIRTWHGAKIDIGGTGLPAPFASLGLSSSVVVSSDLVSIDAAVLTLGRDMGFTQAVVQALPLSLVLASVAASLTAVSTALASVSAILGVPGQIVCASPGSPAVINIVEQGALSAAVTTASTALAAAVTQLATVGLPAITGGCATNTTVA